MITSVWTYSVVRGIGRNKRRSIFQQTKEHFPFHICHLRMFLRLLDRSNQAVAAFAAVFSGHQPPKSHIAYSNNEKWEMTNDEWKMAGFMPITGRGTPKDEKGRACLIPLVPMRDQKSYPDCFSPSGLCSWSRKLSCGVGLPQLRRSIDFTSPFLPLISFPTGAFGARVDQVRLLKALEERNSVIRPCLPSRRTWCQLSRRSPYRIVRRGPSADGRSF